MGFPHTRKVQGHTRTSWTALLDYLEDQGIPVPFQVDLVTRLAPPNPGQPASGPGNENTGPGRGHSGDGGEGRFQWPEFHPQPDVAVLSWWLYFVGNRQQDPSARATLLSDADLRLSALVFARFNTLVDLCARAAGLAETQLRQGIKADARRVSRVLRQMLDEGLLHRQGGGKGATLTSTS